MTDSNALDARKLHEKWQAQDEILDYRNWLTEYAASLQSQLESTEAQNKLLKDALTDVTNYFWGESPILSEGDVQRLVEDALASIPGSKEDKK